jgi:hypothetical protein
MNKTYRYKNLSYTAADDDEVNFTIKFISDGNMGQTVINVPGDNDPEIEDNGTVQLGKGEDLRGNKTVCFSTIRNPVPEEDNIIIEYSINDELLVKHENEKAEEENPFIVLVVEFPEPEDDE